MSNQSTRTAAKSSAAPSVEMPPAPVENLPAPRPRANSVNAIVPSTWQEVTAMAGAICRARMAPKSYCDRDGNPFPDKVAIAIMHGMEVGMTPMASLQSLAVINGMPSLYGDGMLAVVRASGLLEDFVEELEWDKQGPVKATCRVKRKGEPTWGVMDCARDDAIKANWWGKDGPWKLTPHRMLQMRARGWALRDKFADVLRGLHSAEEMEDMVDVTPRSSATTTTAPAKEPKQGDYAQPPTDTTKQASPSTQESNGPSGGEGGQPANLPAGAGGDSKPEAASRPASKVTDVEDENDAPEKAKPGEKLEFATYEDLKEFTAFAEDFLSKTNDEGARQFEVFYHDDIVKLEKGSKNARAWGKWCRERLLELVPLREPGQEG